MGTRIRFEHAYRQGVGNTIKAWTTPLRSVCTVKAVLESRFYWLCLRATNFATAPELRGTLTLPGRRQCAPTQLNASLIPT